MITKSLTINASELGSGITIKGYGTKSVIKVSNGATVVLNNLKIKGGGGDYGGGVFVDGEEASLETINTEISENSASKSGGGVYVNGGSYTSKNTNFSNNTAENYGGGVYLEYGTYESVNTNFSENTANTKNGGAVFVDNNSTLTVVGGSFSGNSANCGGAFANSGVMTIYGETTIREETVSGTTTISNNRAKLYGGAYLGCGTLTVENEAIAYKTTFSGNTAGYDADGEISNVKARGGAIYNDVNGANVGTVTIDGYVDFSNNKAVERGGAIMSYSTKKHATEKTLTVEGTTQFTGNEASQYGGAIDVGQYCCASLGGNLTFDGNKATSESDDQGFGGAIFSVGSLAFETDGTYTFEENEATKSGGAIDACDGTLALAGAFTFNSNAAKGVYEKDQTGLGGAIATAAKTTLNDARFTWGTDDKPNEAARGNCVALDSEISPSLNAASFGLGISDNDYSTFRVIRYVAVNSMAILPTKLAPNAVAATITVDGVSTTIGSEGATPEELGLGVGTHEALIQYTDEDGETSATYSLVLTVDPAASVEVRETSLANGRGVKFDFNLTKADGRAVSVWEVSWGDGTTTRFEQLSTSCLAAHYYAKDGAFDVSLTVVYLDGTSETFDAFSTQTIGTSPVATTSKSDALAFFFADSEDLFDEFGELDDLTPYGPSPLR